MHLYFNFLSDFSESLELIKSEVLLFLVIENCKSALCEKMYVIELSGVIALFHI